MVLCLLAGGALGARAIERDKEIGDVIPVNSLRTAAARQLINPNTASVASLRRLGGIGPAKARAIVDFRTRHGGTPFRSPADLRRVKGIGPGIADNIAGDLCFGALHYREAAP
ncbi:MAG: ComEA family DNA-binding protein [Planctomycetes bacterium]|nr:ComEA family DNA-binding protein [Planctomycetota bacterium]